MTHLNLQEVTIGPIFGRDWTEIYLTLSLVFVRQNHDPSGRTRGHCLTIFWGYWTEKCSRWSLKYIGLHHDPSGRTWGDYFFLFFAGIGRTRGDSFAFLDVLVVYFILYLQKYVVHTKVCHKVCLCVTYWPKVEPNLWSFSPLHRSRQN